MNRWITLLGMIALVGPAACRGDDSGGPADDGGADAHDAADEAGGPDEGDTTGGPDTTDAVDAVDAVDTPGDAPESDVPTAEPFPDDTQVIFLHHSTGEVIWGGGVPEALAAYDDAHGTSYAIVDRNYPSGDPYPWQNYPWDYWNIWVSHAGPAQYEGEDTLELLAPAYRVIVFKHCFPVSDIEPDTGSPDVTSDVKTIENYELQYQALKTKLHSFPDLRFLVWTGAAETAANTTPERAARARQFFAWVKTDWDEPGDNIFVFDFFELETEGGNVLLDANASSPSDSHPSAAFAARVAPLFVNRLISVIRGTGDSTSLTGE